MDTPIESTVSFATLALKPAILRVLEYTKFIVPTPIQAQAIPVALTGVDVIGIAQTGTGKTLAFGLPILNRLLDHPNERALIIVPTRELALQVEEDIKRLSRSLTPVIHSVVLIGGMPIYRQTRDLQSHPQLVVATPGRLRDHLEQRTLKLDLFKILVLDEADRMLDMGFLPQIKYICGLLPTTHQTLLFSATLAPEIARLASDFQSNPTRIEVAPAGTGAAQVTHELCYVEKNDKPDLLKRVLDAHDGTVLVFSRTKHGARKLAERVAIGGHKVAQIHANRSLSQRRQALDGFKNGRYRVLIATDIASRGIDVKDIQLVVNYDLPDASEDYIHRTGRTGRAGREGHAISFATLDQARDVAAIERLLRQPLPLSNHSLPAPRVIPGSSQPRFSSRPRSFNRSSNFRRKPAWR